MAASINIKRLPVDPGPAGWDCLLPDRAPAVALDETLNADWLVIGAGFAGLAATRRLTQLCPTDRIVVLEARRVALGPAGRNSGFMIDLPHDLSSSDYGGALAKDIALTSDNRHAIDFAGDMARDFNMSDEVFVRSGKINGAATEKGHRHNQDYAAHLAKMGEPCELYDASQMQHLTGTDYYRSGLFTGGTAVIQPAMFVRDVARGLTSNRVRIFEDSPVTSLHRDQDWVAATPNGQIRAPKVILAVNGHLNSFGFAQGRLMHIFTYASMTRALTKNEVAALGGSSIWGLTPADPMGTTVRRISGTGGDRIVVRNRFTFDPTMAVDSNRILHVTKDHDRAFAARFPMLRDVEMQHRWGGRLCLSRNNVSVISEVETNLFSACCQNGLGTTRGTLSGKLAAELATGTASERLSRALDTEPPTKLPPGLFAGLGAKAILKWQELKAGAEL
ncbi:MAG: FAD-binding oxidoreductase [Paracoccaceae bacterium]